MCVKAFLAVLFVVVVVVLAVAHPCASASSYLSSQSLADSRCNFHAISHLEHLECSHQPHIQGRGAEERTQHYQTISLITYLIINTYLIISLLLA